MNDYSDTAVLGTGDRFAIPQPAFRSEDPVLLRGEGHYSDGLNRPDPVYAAVVGGPVVHGGVPASPERVWCAIRHSRMQE